MVEFMLVPAYYKEDVTLSKEALSALGNKKNVAIFASVQFIKLEKVIAQLKEAGIKVISTHGKRTSGKYQLLGCDCFNNSFADNGMFNEIDAILYVGDGMFHPRALLLAQKGIGKKVPVILYDPISKRTKEIKFTDIEHETRRYRANMLKYLSARTIGVLISVKPGQQYLKLAIALKEKEKDKQVYFFIDDTFNFASMENFPFIDVWVNTACPRIGYDDFLNMPRPLVNINDALAPEEALRKCS